VHLSGSVAAGRIAVTRTGARAKLIALKHGPVVLVVGDRSAKDNFHLVGPGVNKATTKAGMGTFTWRLTLRRGLYTYRSDATPSLKGSFRAT
jgi:hypothetical protein